MNILFVVDSASAGVNAATATLLRRVAEGFSERGHSCSILDLLYDEQSEKAYTQGVMLYNAYCQDQADVYRFISDGLNKGYSRPMIVLKMLLKPSLAFSAFKFLVLKRGPERDVLKKEIESLCNQNNYDYVVAASAPFEASFALSDADITAKKAAYLCDPYTKSLYFNTAKDVKEETKLYEQLEDIFISIPMIDDYKGEPFERFSNKISVVPLPGVVKNDTPPKQTSQNGKAINCVFVGNLYWNIRRPDFLLDIFKNIDDQNIKLTFVGGGYDNFPKGFFQPYKEILKDRLVFTGSVPLSEAYSYMNGADILLNIGNEINNQLTSKILEYVSSGKPILNFCKIDDDPCLEYLERYGLSETVYEKDGVNEDTVKKAYEFCIKNKGTTKCFEAVEKMFYEHTTNNAVDIMSERFFKN